MGKSCLPASGNHEELVDIKLPGVPFAQVNLPGIMVVYKPENWEVNRGDPAVHRPNVEWRLLSDWVTLALPQSKYPLVHSSKFDFGFIHRLDVPSSGLIIAAKNFAGHALMRFQLDTHLLCREYIVVCVDPIKPACREVCRRLTVDKIKMKTYVSETGVCALTLLKPQAYAWPHLDPDNLDTLIAIQIFTGRHHQIRAHLTFLQHPTIADGRYGLSEVMLKDDHIYGDMMWFEQFFRRPVVPLFHESGPNRQNSQLMLAKQVEAPHELDCSM